MKRILLSLTLLATAYLGNSQVILNEVYTTPGGGLNEYFELYNTSINPNPINLDCYSLVVMYSSSSSNKGFYLIDFPNVSIQPKSYLVGASNDPFNAQNSKELKDIKPAFNWNSLGGSTGGSITKYELKNGSLVKVDNGIPSNFNNLFSQLDKSMQIQYAFFLFDNNGKYINGLITDPSKKDGKVPTTITKDLPLVTVPTSCSSLSKNLTIDWTLLTQAEFAGSNDGTNNGFIRKFDGNCGTWTKAASGSAHTPGYTNNAPGTTLPTIGTLQTTPMLICGSKIEFRITGPTDASLYDVKVHLYWDKNSDKTLDLNDDFVNTIVVSSASINPYSFTGLDPQKNYLVVYETALGCYDKVVSPEIISGNLNTIEKIVCGNTVDFSITGTTGNVGSYIFPASVEVHYDLNNNGIIDDNNNGTVDGEEEVHGVETLTGLNITKSITLADPTQKILLLYKTAAECYNKVVSPLPADVNFKTTQINVCGEKVEFSITNPGVDIAKYGYPIVVQLYTTKGDPLVYEPGIDQPVGTAINITSIPTTQSYSIPTQFKNQDLLVTYSTATACYSQQVIAKKLIATLVAEQKSFCGKSVEFKVITADGDLSNPVYGSITASLYEDNGTIGAFDAADVKVPGVASIAPTTGSTYTFQVPVAYQTKPLLVVYQANASCLGNAYTPVQDNKKLNVALYAGISTEIVNTDKRIATYKVIKDVAFTDAAAYPMTLKIYEVASGNDLVIAPGQVALQTKTITSPTSADNIEYTIEVNRYSSIIVTAESIYGCSSKEVPVDINNIILPVTYKSFNATRNKNKVALTWETSTEINNKGFHVQRNINGEWKNIAFVFSQADGGNSTADLSYSYNDINTAKGISQYRILQVDNDGRGKYSEIRAVRGESEVASHVSVFPNPSSTGSFTVLFEEGTANRDVTVSDAAGRMVKNYKAVSSNTLTVQNLQNGFYTVQIANRTTGAITVEKVIIKKR